MTTQQGRRGSDAPNHYPAGHPRAVAAAKEAAEAKAKSKPETEAPSPAADSKPTADADKSTARRTTTSKES